MAMEKRNSSDAPPEAEEKEKRSSGESNILLLKHERGAASEPSLQCAKPNGAWANMNTFSERN
jgi:hypothetical protein